MHDYNRTLGIVKKISSLLFYMETCDLLCTSVCVCVSMYEFIFFSCMSNQHHWTVKKYVTFILYAIKINKIPNDALEWFKAYTNTNL